MSLLGAPKEGLSKRSHALVKKCKRLDRHRVSQGHKT